ncbi:hypothetical protein HK098_006004 [Nowakowskiella sp. JEL0407]|nr:hypothetical protein HK098_006004 [Nowakowskiella sp. JEL0407]
MDLIYSPRLHSHEHEKPEISSPYIPDFEKAFTSNPPALNLTDSPLSIEDSAFKHGAPSRPYISAVFETTIAWFRRTEYPFIGISTEYQSIGVSETRLEDIKDVHACRDSIWKEIRKCMIRTSMDTIIADEFATACCEYLISIGKRGIILLLGHRYTVGSSFRTLPPSMDDCISSFLFIHPKDLKGKKISTKTDKEPVYLTVGAKALSKHAHRDETTGWWGNVTGTLDDKNKHAIMILAKLFSGAVWFNIHQLGADIQVYEIRNKLGYGCRWYLTGHSHTHGAMGTATLGAAVEPSSSKWCREFDECRMDAPGMIEFRGFLEPPMADGHAIGWIH